MEYTTENSFLHFPSVKDLSLLSDSERRATRAPGTTWCLTEKLDGSNLQIVVSRKGYTFCTRKQKLDKKEALDLEQKIPKGFLSFCFEVAKPLIRENYDTEVHFFGELFGNRVIDRIPYEKPYDFRCFGMCFVDGEREDWLTRSRMKVFFSFWDASEWLVPLLGCFETFDEAISFDPRFVASFVPEGEECLAEGFVVSPYSIEDGDGTRLPRSVKVKNPEFSEMDVRKYGGRVNPENKESLDEYRELFRGFCNQNRMIGIFSKYGKPEGMRDAGNYCRWFIEDAYRDFLSAYPEIEEKFNSDELRELRNIGSQGFLIFKGLFG